MRAGGELSAREQFRKTSKITGKGVSTVQRVKVSMPD
jgi:hypothetical protein